MSNDDIFAPPSKEELDNSMFSAPTADELKTHASSTEPVSQLESLGKGFQQGGSLGFADEGAGAIQGGLDATMSLLHKLGITNKSPTEVNKALAESGVKGDLGPKDSTEMYRQGRDEDRAEIDAARNANPLTFLGGTLAGGLATGKAIPGKLLSPLGAAATDADLATKMAMGAANAVPVGAVAGLGSGKADLTQGDISGAAEDMKNGAETGAAIGGAIPLVGAGLSAGKDILLKGAKKIDSLDSKLANLIPENLKTHYKRGQAGIDTTTPEFYQDTINNQNAVTDEVANPILSKIEQQKAAQNSQVQDINGKILTSEGLTKNAVAETEAKQAAQQADIESQIKDIQDQSKKAIDLGEAKQKATTAEELNNINKDKVKVAENLQKRVYDVKQDLGKQFDELEKAAEQTGVVPKTQDIVQGVQNSLAQKSTLTPQQIESISKRLGSASDPGGYQGFKNVKQELSTLFEHADPTVRSVAKQAYSALKNSYAEDLKANGYTELANKMAETNGRWGAMSELEDQFLSNIRGPNRHTGEIQAHPDTIKAVDQFSEKNPVQMAQANYLTNLLQKFGGKGLPPEAPAVPGAPPAPGQLPSNPIGQSINEMGAVSDAAQAAKAAGQAPIPQLPNPKLTQLQEMLTQSKQTAPQTPELPNAGTSQLQEQLGQVKSQNPNDIPGLKLNTSSPEALKSDLLKTLPKAGMQTGDINSENKLGQLYDFLKKTKGEDYVKNLQERLKPLNEDIQLRNAGKSTEEIPTTMGKVVSKVLGGVSGVANKLGRMNQQNNEAFLKVGADKLSNASPEQMETLASGMDQMGTIGKKYAEVLRSSTDKNSVSRSATINSLMQQPAFRALFHGANGTHDEGTGDESK